MGARVQLFHSSGLKGTPSGTTVIEDNSYEFKYLGPRGRINTLIVFFPNDDVQKLGFRKGLQEPDCQAHGVPLWRMAWLLPR